MAVTTEPMYLQCTPPIRNPPILVGRLSELAKQWISSVSQIRWVKCGVRWNPFLSIHATIPSLPQIFIWINPSPRLRCADVAGWGLVSHHNLPFGPSKKQYCRKPSRSLHAAFHLVRDFPQAIIARVFRHHPDVSLALSISPPSPRPGRTLSYSCPFSQRYLQWSRKSMLNDVGYGPTL